MTRTRSFGVTAAVLLSLGAMCTTYAQQKVPFANGVPVAPSGLADQPLANGPFTYKTAETMDVRVSIVGRLESPYSMAFLPGGDMLVTQRTGEMRLMRDGKLTLVTGGPPSTHGGKSGGLGAVHGYMAIAVHPQFEKNHLVYFAYTQAASETGKRPVAAVARARLDGTTLKDLKDVIVLDSGGAVALAMTPDAKLFVATSGNGQDTKSLGGKVLRLGDDGSVPKDNPFVGKDGYRAEIYSLGHRSCLGLTVHPTTGEVWLSEMGPNGGDEINLIKAGKNYGWPLVSLGRTYPGPWQAEGKNMPTHEGFEPPVVYWMPSISVSGLTFYTGDKLPKWKGDLFVGGVRYGETPGTGRLDRVLLNEKMEELRRETLLADLHQRIRDVKTGPDGYLYVATDEVTGAILKIEPASKTGS